MADSLADLFVSYKAVERPKKSKSYSSNRSSLYGYDTDYDNPFADFDQSTRGIRSFWSYPYGSYYSSSVVKASSTERETPVDVTPSGYLGRPFTGFSEWTNSELGTAAVTRNQLVNLLENFGLKEDEDYEITEVYRPTNVNYGENNSYHHQGRAIDLVLLDKDGKHETDKKVYEEFVGKLASDSRFVDALSEIGMGILPELEASNTPGQRSTGMHLHFGPDSRIQNWAGMYQVSSERTGGLMIERAKGGIRLKASENAANNWINKMFSAYKSALKDKYGDKYDGAAREKIALYMTAQTAILSDYGQAENNNYADLRTKTGDRAKFDSIGEFARAEVNVLDGWDVMDAQTLHEYVDKLYSNDDGMIYDASEQPELLYSKMEKTAREINDVIGLSMKIGGRFERVREIYSRTHHLLKK